MEVNIILSIFYGFIFASLISFGHVFTERLRAAYYEKSRKKIKKKWQFILSGRSKCDNCHKTLNPVYIIPLAGYFFSRGKCPSCQAKISHIYPLEEGISFVYGFLFFYLNNEHLVTIFMGLFLLICYIISNLDYLYYLIPTEALAVFFLVTVIEKIVYYDQIQNLILLLSVPLCWYILLRLIDYLMPGKLGRADIHYIFILSLAMDFPNSIFLPTVASFLALFYFFTAHFKRDWSELKIIKIPFGLFLSLAFLILKLIPIPDFIF